MPRYDKGHSLDRFQDKRRRHRHSGARETTRRLSWLWQQAVYWAGPGEDLPEPLIPECRTVLETISKRLSGCGRGLFAVEVDFSEDSLTPKVGNVHPVNGQLLASASWQLSKLQKQSADVDVSSHNLDDWKDTAYQRLMLFSAAFQASEKSFDEDASSLLIEASSAWLGNPDRRPSQQLPTAVLEHFLDEQQANDEDRTGRLAAVVLGCRNQGRVPLSLQPWKTMGQLLNKWPPCVLGQFSRQACRDVTTLARQWPEFNHPEWAEGLREFLFCRGSDAKALAFFKHVPPLLLTCKRLELEPRERLQQLLEAVGEALHETAAFVRMPESDSFCWNHDFVGACKQKLMENLQLRDVPLFGTDQLKGLQDFCHWFLDVKLRDLDMMRLKKLQADKERDPNYIFLQQLQRILERHLEIDAAVFRRALAAATGRISFITSPDVAPTALAAWTDHCRQICLPGEHGLGSLRLALKCLFNTFTRIAPEAERERILTIAADYGKEILETLQRRLECQIEPPASGKLMIPLTQTEENHENLLLLLASIPQEYEEYITLLFEEHLLVWFNQISRQRAEAIPMAMSFLLEVDRQWFELSSSEQMSWSLLLQIDSLSLSKRLADWTTSIRRTYKVAWEEIEIMLNHVIDFICFEGDEKPHQKFLRKHIDILDSLLDSALQSCSSSSNEDWEPGLLFAYRKPFLTVFHEWHRQNYEGLGDLVPGMLEEAGKQDRRLKRSHLGPEPYIPDGSDLELAVLLSGGDLKRLWAALRNHTQQEYPYPAHAADGWRFLSNAPHVQMFLSRLMDRPELIVPVKVLLQRMALAIRLHSSKQLRQMLKRWEASPDVNIDLPDELSDACRTALRQVAGLRQLNGAEQGLPNSIRRILNRPTALHREYDDLTRRVDKEIATQTVSFRLGNLQTYIDDPVAMQEWISRDLEKELEKQLQLERLRYLENIVSIAIGQHWEKLVGDQTFDDTPDGENALLLCTCIEHNRRLLKELMKHMATQGNRPFADHPLNQRFLSDLAGSGVDSECWCSPKSFTFEIGDETLTAELEMDPLRVLQMGNLFGTCLKVGGDHAYSTVANAIEVNKQLIYVRNARGHIVGRKLIVLDPQGRLFGFNTYGSSIWYKIMLDRFCRRIADDCGCILATTDDIAALDPETLRLFAKWYFDPAEAFDPWVTAEEPIVAAEEILQTHCAELFQENRQLALRACLVLGEAAIPILRENLAYIHPSHLRTLRRETNHGVVRSFVDGALEC